MPVTNRQSIDQDTPIGAILAGGVACVGAGFLLSYFAVRVMGGPPADDPFARFTAILSNGAYVLLVVAAIAAGYLARDQFRQARRKAEVAERARLATVYLDIARRWYSDEIARARRAIMDLKGRFDPIACGTTSLPDFVCRTLTGPIGTKLLGDCDAVLSFFGDRRVV